MKRPPEVDLALTAIRNLRKQLSKDTIQVAVLKRDLDECEKALERVGK